MTRGKHLDIKNITGMLILFAVLGCICILVYKTNIRWKLDKPIYATLMTEHKETGEVVLSANEPMLTETFVCKVPELTKISLEGRQRDAGTKAILTITLSDIKTGKNYFQKDAFVRDIFSSNDEIVDFDLDEVLTGSEGRELKLTIELKNATKVKVYFTSNTKPGIVSAFGQNEENHTNIIWSMEYFTCRALAKLYILFSIVLILFAELSYWMICVKRMRIQCFYFPIAFAFGLIIQCVITIYGVPDEPTHMDTAYKYSNKILSIEETGHTNSIYKRRCDVEMCDMLANGVESNSYFQMMAHTFEKPDNTELIEVEYSDGTNLVPGIIYLPAAFGLTVGRILGMSSMMTMQLARIFNLLAFSLLTYAAILITPFGKNIFGLVGILPISLQQGGSASYDAVVNGIVFLFLAVSFRMWIVKQSKNWEYCVLTICACLIVVVKGGVYIPVLSTLFFIKLPFLKSESAEENKGKKRWKKVLLIAVGICFVVTFAVLKSMPVISNFIYGNGIIQDENSIYTVAYFLERPLDIIYIYWNTFLRVSDDMIRGMFGGMLSWLDIKINWTFLIVLIMCGFMFANMEDDRFQGNQKSRIVIGVSCATSIFLVILSMMLGYTAIRLNYVSGLQGRYLLPLLPLLLLLSSNSIVHVKERGCYKIWMTVIMTIVFIALQVVLAIE